MTNGSINPKVLDKLNRNSQGDDQIAAFVKELMYQELENRSGWWWRKVYKRKLEEYSAGWRAPHEDQ